MGFAGCSILPCSSIVRSHAIPECLYMGVDQNYGPFWGSVLQYIPYSSRGRKGPIILINPHIQLCPKITGQELHSYCSGAVAMQTNKALEQACLMPRSHSAVKTSHTHTHALHNSTMYGRSALHAMQCSSPRAAEYAGFTSRLDLYLFRFPANTPFNQQYS